MKKDEYIQALIAKNPALGKPDEEKVTLTCRGIRAIINQAYDMGFQEAQEKAKTEKKVDDLFRSTGGWPF